MDHDLDRDIGDLPLPTQALNALRRAGINTVGELLAQPDDRLVLLRNFGVGSLRKVKQALALLGLAPEPAPAARMAGHALHLAEPRPPP